MDVGETIRLAREEAQLGRSEVSKRAGIPKDTLKKIESGKTGVSLSMLERIASALGRSARELVPVANDAGAPLGPKGTPFHLTPTHIAELSPLPEYALLDHREPGKREAVSLESSPEYWILRGDDAAHHMNLVNALHDYEQAEALMPRRDYTWARLVLERIGQTLINLNAFEQLEHQLQRVESEYLQPFTDHFGVTDERIHMLVEEKRAWKATWGGDSVEAAFHAGETQRLALSYGDEPDSRITALHMEGRALCEPSTTAVLYNRLFPAVTWTTTTRKRLERAEAILRSVQADEQREISRGFNAQWLARTLRAQGKLYEARQFDRYWRQLFARDVVAAEAKLDLAKLILVDGQSDRSEGIGDARDILGSIWEPFKQWRYAPGLAESAITEAYLRLIGHQTSTASKRSQAIDFCVVSLCLHPYKRHAITMIARKLASSFIREMSDVEFRAYFESAPDRIASREPPFDLLDHVYAPTGIDTLGALNDLKQQGAK